MHKFNALGVAATVASLNGLMCRCAKEEIQRGKGAPIEDPDFLEQVRLTLKNAMGIGWSGSLPTCRRVAQQADGYIKDDTDISSLKVHLVNVVNAIFADVQKMAFLRVEERRAKFIDHEPFFDIDQTDRQRSVYEAFPSARGDAKEAGNCMAADCNTAAVFHMMRAVEWALRALCVDLGYRSLKCTDKKTKKVTYKPLDRATWDAILTQIQSRVKERIKKLPAGKRRQDLEEFYLPALQDLEGFKDAFRNHVMHARRHYSAQEAEAIRDRVQRFMRHLAARIVEA